MTGITYAITEIILFLAIAAGLGFFIGRLTVRQMATPDASASKVKDLEARIATLSAATAPVILPDDAALRKDLEVATWEIEALQEEVARLQKGKPEVETQDASEEE